MSSHLTHEIERLQPPYLQNSQIRIGTSTEKGIGLYASQEILPGTVIEISPVLLFSKEEYDNHGKYTLLDHYTINWPDGRMALALGLGSLFSHSDAPNVSFSINASTGTIRYTTCRTIRTNDELCIFYGHHSCFKPAGVSRTATNTNRSSDEQEDKWKPMNSVLNEANLYTGDNSAEYIPENELPFERTKIVLDDEDEDYEGSVRAMKVWVVDVPDLKSISALLKWVKSEGLETPDLVHLKRIRRQGLISTLLLTGAPAAHPIPDAFGLPVPYQTDVPTAPALTMKSLKLKLQLWPTVYAPRRKHGAEPWSRARVAWAWEAVQRLMKAAEEAKAAGELPMVSYVPRSFMDSDAAEAEGMMPTFLAYDGRKSSSHPLRHSIINVIRKVAEWRATVSSSIDENPGRGTGLPIGGLSVTETEPSENIRESQDGASSRANGAHYLLTSLTLFTTHEPCIMCSMALLHSRVREVIFLRPMADTGGCGGHDGRGVCIPRLQGVNHRFSILRWKINNSKEWETSLAAMEGIDA